MRTPDDDAERRRRRDRRDARVRDAIAAHLMIDGGWHQAIDILAAARLPRGTHPAAIWPALRELVDQGRIVASMLDLVEPCHGFAFRRTVPIFAHWGRFSGGGVARG